MKSVFFLPTNFFCFFLSGSSSLSLVGPLDVKVLADFVSAGVRLWMMPRAKDGTSVGTESSATYSSILVRKEEAYLIPTVRFLLSKVDIPNLTELVFFEFDENCANNTKT